MFVDKILVFFGYPTFYDYSPHFFWVIYPIRF